MLAEAGGARIPQPEARVAVIVALGVERACVRRASSGVALTQSGPGEARAAEAAMRAVEGGARALVSFGLAGGLVPDATPGRLLLPRQVLTAAAHRFDVDSRWHARLVEALAPELVVDERPLLAADGVLPGPAAKQRGAELGAAAVDLESGAIAGVAFRRAVPFAVVRAVADGPDDELPVDVSSWVGADGETRLPRVLAAALKPRNWAPLWILSRRYHAARRTLERAAGRLAPQDFLFA